jgi:YHS domain-containing protein
MRVDRYATDCRLEFDGKPVYFCSAACREEFERAPERYADALRRTRGFRPLGLLSRRS